MSIIQTNTGAYFDVLAPYKHNFDIEEIAHALSNLCRFTGHVREFYSVAQHSYYVSVVAGPKHALAGLLHDATEAYVGDVASPLKRLLPEYKKIEERIWLNIALQYGISSDLPKEVHDADLRMLVTEKNMLMPRLQKDPQHWPDVRPVLMPIIQPLPPKQAKALFLRRYADLMA